MPIDRRRFPVARFDARGGVWTEIDRVFWEVAPEREALELPALVRAESVSAMVANDLAVPRSDR